MIYLSGSTARYILSAARPNLGLMAQPGNSLTRLVCPSGLPWAADNGCYAQGEHFDAEAWLAWLRSLAPWRATCLFAVAPDVVGNAEATLERATPYLAQLRTLGYRAAFASQDGATSDLIPWDSLDCLFVGGTNEWKLSEASYSLVSEATRRGKWTHQGRANSLRRLRAAAVAGFESADGTMLAFDPTGRGAQLRRWLDELERSPHMALATPRPCEACGAPLLVSTTSYRDLYQGEASVCLACAAAAVND